VATEVSPKGNRLFIVIGIILAALAAILVLVITKSSSDNGVGQTQQVVVAKVDLAQGVAITSAMVELAPEPAPVPADSVTSLTGAVGQVPNVPLTAHSAITQSVLQSAQVAPLGELSITDGDVAMAIPTSGGTTYSSADLENVGNYVQPEDHIDILIADATGTIRYAFQDVRVLRVGDNTGAAAVPANGGAATAAAPSLTPTVLIVELPRNQAELMTYLISRPTTTVDANGKPIGPQDMIVKYVLRPRDAYSKDPKAPSYLSSVGTPLPTAPDPGANAAQMNALFGIH